MNADHQDRIEWLEAWTGLAAEIRAAADQRGYSGSLDLRCEYEAALRHRLVRGAFDAVDILLLLPGQHAKHPVTELDLRIENRVFDVAARLVDFTSDTELGAWALPWTRTRLVERPVRPATDTVREQTSASSGARRAFGSPTTPPRLETDDEPDASPTPQPAVWRNASHSRASEDQDSDDENLE
jgi:hypothetical protein